MLTISKRLGGNHITWEPACYQEKDQEIIEIKFVRRSIFVKEDRYVGKIWRVFRYV